jgi:DNA-binding response OmpR family regulator
MPRKVSRASSRRITASEVNVLKLFVRSALGSADAEMSEATIGRLRVDFRSGTMMCDDQPIATSATELNLLRYFLFRRGEIVSRDEIFRDVWGYANPPASRSVDNYILLLRKKIERDPAAPQHLLALRGAGYKLVSDAGPQTRT